MSRGLGDVYKRQVRYLLGKLREEGKIVNIGTDKTPKWIIK